MHKKITRLALCALLFAYSFPVQAQQPPKIPRIGFVSSGSGDPKFREASVEAFRQGLLERGYVEGKNIQIEYRYAEGDLDRVPRLIAELVQLKVDVLVPGPFAGVLAAKEATTTIPIVMVSSVDPVASGIVKSLARPGGNITGFSTLSRELSGKRLELLKEAVPGMSRVAVLWDVNAPGPAVAIKELKAVGPALKIQLQSLEVRGPDPDLDGAFRAAVKGKANALFVSQNPLLSRYRKRIADLAIKNRLPSMCEGTQWVEDGCLMTYGTNTSDQYRRAAYYVDRILKGTKPADLPVEQPMKFEFVINKKTADQIGLTIPQWPLMKADRMIR
ncbi:MAG: ABC transporter substrate-binding protein [Deltaproteobacteria bacterium]|nr:ABC transporter substrate-binding protein [Deltaproteobacteria bacterium]